MTDFTELKKKQRATWALGEYDRIADAKVRWGREYLITRAVRA